MKDLDDKRAKRRRKFVLADGITNQKAMTPRSSFSVKQVSTTLVESFTIMCSSLLKICFYGYVTRLASAMRICMRPKKSKLRDNLFANLPTSAADFVTCTPVVPRGRILTCSKLTLLLILISCPPFRNSTESPAVPASGKVANAAAMGLFDIWVLIFLVLIAPVSIAHPFNTRSQSLALTNGASPEVNSHGNLTSLGQDYPVYPTTCFPPPSRGRQVSLPDLTNVLSDCSWIINRVLLQQTSLLFQDLLINYNTFKDKSSNRYLSRWHRGRCVISVAFAEKNEQQILQLFNVVLAAKKILKECIEDQRILHGGTTFIGSQNKSFYVGVMGLQDSDAANESNVSLLSNLDLSGRDIQRSLLRITASSFEDHYANDSPVSLPPSVSMGRRASDPQHGSSLATDTQSLVRGGALSTSNLVLPSKNLSGSVEAPPSYPVNCFNPYSATLKPAAVEDCQFVINQIILRYMNPMSPQTFGYSASADIDLSLPQNRKWIFGHCAIFVKNTNKARTDTFRMVDVAYTAHNIITKCVSGVKYPLGGFADVGTVADNFYVCVGGVDTTDATNTTIPQYSSSVDLVEDGIGTHGAL